MSDRIVKIGGAAGFWGDSSVGAPQLAEVPGMRYIVFDYLAELTMSILAAARAKNRDLGYATDFVEVVAREILAQCRERGIRLIANAGGVNPGACARALERLAAELGVPVKVAVADGDEVLGLVPRLRERGVTDFHTGAPMPERLLSANAYFGALPIASALERGADVIVTGRVVDSAVTLGALIHEFGWRADDYDRLAAGSLAGHLIECGCQATGGLFTDWEDVPDWANMGYPVLECAADGSFVVTKAEATGGIVSPPSLAEQLLYEIGDPANYVLPDVVCDFTRVTLEQVGSNRVAVRGAKGLPPTASYKVSATHPDGFRCTASCLIAGIDAVQKARRVSQAIIAKTEEMFAERGWGPYKEVSIELLGSEATYGAHGRRQDSREVVIKLAVRHARKEALLLFSREIAPAATGMAPGLTGIIGGRPTVYPVIRLFSFLVDKSACALEVELNGQRSPVALPQLERFSPAQIASAVAAPLPSGQADASVPLIKLAVARSGDKGNHSNIGVMARTPEYLPWIAAALSEGAVADWLQHVLDPQSGKVSRWYLPGSHSLNFLLENALGGGGVASLRIDPQGKAFAQQLLEFPVPVPRALAEQLTATTP